LPDSGRTKYFLREELDAMLGYRTGYETAGVQLRRVS